MTSFQQKSDHMLIRDYVTGLDHVSISKSKSVFIFIILNRCNMLSLLMAQCVFI